MNVLSKVSQASEGFNKGFTGEGINEDSNDAFNRNPSGEGFISFIEGSNEGLTGQ